MAIVGYRIPRSYLTGGMATLTPVKFENNSKHVTGILDALTPVKYERDSHDRYICFKIDNLLLTEKLTNGNAVPLPLLFY